MPGQMRPYFFPMRPCAIYIIQFSPVTIWMTSTDIVRLVMFIINWHYSGPSIKLVIKLEIPSTSLSVVHYNNIMSTWTRNIILYISSPSSGRNQTLDLIGNLIHCQSLMLGTFRRSRQHTVIQYHTTGVPLIFDWQMVDGKTVISSGILFACKPKNRPTHTDTQHQAVGELLIFDSMKTNINNRYM